MAVRLEDIKDAQYAGRQTAISSCISTNSTGFPGGYTDFVQMLFERAKFFFGVDKYVYSFGEWAAKHTNEEVLYVIEKTGLLYEERRRLTTTRQNPFQLCLDVLDDPRSKLDFNSRGELMINIPNVVCNDYQLFPPAYGDVKNMLIATLAADMCRRSDSNIPTQEAVAIVLEVCKEVYPEGYLDTKKTYWGMYNVFDELPYDYDIMRAVLERCRDNYQPTLDEINARISAAQPDVGPVQPGQPALNSEQLEIAELYVG